jgi:hypothetical protein
MRETVRDGARKVLTETWKESEGYCPPNPGVYPHRWLWDSCFHAIAWAELFDDRAARELESCFEAQLGHGFVPHMRYSAPSINRGPLATSSSFTQPPIYAHAARVIRERDGAVSPRLTAKIEAALDYLWANRRTEDGLLYIVHPWESGSDDSPRWDSWLGRADWDSAAFPKFDHSLVADTLFDYQGAAVWSRRFVAAPAAFNAFAGHAAIELAALTGSVTWRRRAAEVGEVTDGELWDERQGMWVDKAIVGGGESVAIPTLDGLFGALVTSDEERANRALGQALDPGLFHAEFGLRFLPRTHPRYRPDQYWRGAAWPQLNYMLGQAARRWKNDDLYRRIADMSMRAALRSGFAEYWNPETGDGLGAIPQGWAAVAASFAR